jgi:kynureninase
MPYHESMRETSARLVGARPGETVIMNSLTVNLHLLMWTFYRPTPNRYRIVVEADAFPSDRYAVDSQAELHGYPPEDAVLGLVPRTGERHLRTEDIVDLLDREGSSIAVVLLGAVNFRTGALLDLAQITAAAHRAGALCGWDLAHAVGNVPLELHDWDVDFAVFCTYKYLNAGPGAAGGAFVHERHGNDLDLPRPAGWWGNDPATRFQMEPRFRARSGADGWQLSNPPILAMAPVRASLDLFDAIGMDALRARSLRLTAFLERVLDAAARQVQLEVVTPRDPNQRGAQLTVEVADAARTTAALHREHGVVTDDRPPRSVRLAPVPLYNTFHDAWRAGVALTAVVPPR